MSDAPERESKTEEPTEKKIRDSVEKGKIPVSREASIFSSMIALLIILSFLTVDSVRQLTSTLGRLMDDPSGIRIRNGADAVEFLTLIGASLAIFLLPIVIVLAIAGLAASFLQNAPQIVFERIKPELSRISLAQGWGRTFGGQGRVEFAKSLFKFFAISIVVTIVLRAEEAVAVNSLFSDPTAVPELILTTAIAAGLDNLDCDDRAGGTRPGLGPLLLASRAAHDEARGQGRVPAGRGRSAG